MGNKRPQGPPGEDAAAPECCSMNPPRWSDQEIEVLRQLSGDYPTSLAIQNFKTWATRNNSFPRSKFAIVRKMKELDIFSPNLRTGYFTTTGGAAELLGCSRHVIDGWLRNSTITAILRPVFRGNRKFVSRDSWRRLATKMPEVFAGFKSDNLFMLLEDRVLANAIAAKFTKRITDFRIRCIETGRIWPDAGKAAKELYISKRQLNIATKKRKSVKCLGLSFERLGNSPD